MSMYNVLACSESAIADAHHMTHITYKGLLQTSEDTMHTVPPPTHVHMYYIYIHTVQVAKYDGNVM